MKVTNIKNVAIWALVIINAFFLAFFFWRLAAEHSEKTEALENLSILLSKNGIYLNTDNIREGDELAALQMNRDIPGEKKLADTLLGQTSMTEQGGIIYTYNGKDGQAVFKNGGEFDITFNAPVYNITASAAATAKNLLRTMSIESISVTATGDAGNETVSAVCSWNHQPIFNCRIEFIFENGNLVKISGKLAAGITETGGKTDMSSPATALMHFLGDVESEKWDCAVIRSVAPGYELVETSDPRAGQLQPVWRIETDTGLYYIDAVTGNIEQDMQ